MIINSKTQNISIKNAWHGLALIFALMMLLPSLVLAQNIGLKAFVSKNKIASDERFQYSIEVSGKSTSLPDVNLPNLNEFYVLSGPNTSTNIQYVNGAMTSSKTLSFVLKPRDVGQFKIGRATISLDDKTLESEPIVITVVKASPASQKKQAGKKQNSSVIPSGDIFLRATVSKKNAYLGEQIIVQYKLYFKTQVRTYELEKNPANTGFWTEDFELPQRPVIESQILNGVNYNVALLKKVAVFPTRVGKLELDPMVVNVEAIVASRRNRRSLFDSFFEPSGRSVRKKVSTKKIVLNISPLPQEGQPKDFDGAVGSYRFDVKINKRESQVNEATTLKIMLSGSGNIKLVKLPEAIIPPDIEQYAPKLRSNISKKSGKITGSKSAEYLLIPRVPGTFKIKPITFSYFDPIKKKYFTKSSGQINLNVTGTATNTNTAPMAGFSRKEVTLLGSDIRFIKERTTFHKISDDGYISMKLLGGFIFAILIFIGFLFWDDRRAKLDGNIALKRNRYAGKLAAKFLSAASKNVNHEDDALFYRSINAALSKFVQDKLNIELTDFSIPNVKQALTKKEIPGEIISEYADLISECDFRQFASAGSSDEDKKLILEKARSVITKLEKYM
jgi:BatD DUF11 like domain